MPFESTKLKITGMHCTSCQKTLLASLEKLEGVKSASVNLIANEAEVHYDPSVCAIRDIKRAVKKIGYHAYLPKDVEKQGQKEMRLLILGALLTAPLLLNMIFPFVPSLIEFVLATLVQFIWGWRFYIGSYYALKNLAANMDLLVCLGISAAYFYSAAVFIFHLKEATYFESAATVIMLVLLGRFLEGRTRGKAEKAIESLYKLQPKTAKVMRGSTWQEIPIEEIVQGDIFQVRPGETIAIDGEILEGDTEIDESMLTGEAESIHKTKGMKIYAATQNKLGSVTAKAISVGKDTALAQIIRSVEEASNSKAPIQKLADRISYFFAPATLLIAIITFFGWWIYDLNIRRAVIYAVTCLIIACPCALGMATPIVIKLAATLAAQRGILIKNAQSLETAAKLALIAFDKTGTLTYGKMVLSDVVPLNNHTKDDVLNTAAALAEPSQHPIAQSLHGVKSTKSLTDFLAIAGKGISGKVDGKLYYLGSMAYLKEKGLIPPIAPAIAPDAHVILFDEKEALAFFTLKDDVRKEAPEAIKKLKEMGLKVVMLTGDKEESTQHIASQVAIEEVIAEVLPVEKLDVIQSFRSQGYVVAMCGDGINDAPTLAAADVSLAMRQGSDIAIQTADVTLINNDLNAIASLIYLSRATKRKIHQNLFLAFFYNAIFLPLAAFGLFNPMIGGVLMALSSFTVVINSLLLNRFEK